MAMTAAIWMGQPNFEAQGQHPAETANSCSTKPAKTARRLSQRFSIPLQRRRVLPARPQNLPPTTHRRVRPVSPQAQKPASASAYSPLLFSLSSASSTFSAERSRKIRPKKRPMSTTSRIFRSTLHRGRRLDISRTPCARKARV